MTSRENVLPELTHRILGCAIEVHRELGPGLLESAYKACLAFCLKDDGMAVEAEVPIPVRFRGAFLEMGYRADLIVEGSVLLELKALDRIKPIHTMQTLTYLQLAQLPVGLLINFNVPILINGVTRLVHRTRPRISHSAS